VRYVVSQVRTDVTFEAFTRPCDFQDLSSGFLRSPVVNPVDGGGTFLWNFGVNQTCNTGSCFLSVCLPPSESCAADKAVLPEQNSRYILKVTFVTLLL
jgi:hypothetical protein